MDQLRSLAEIAFGLLFAVGATFNAAYTRTNDAEFYGSFAKGAWLPPAPVIIERVAVSYDKVVTVLIIVLQASVEPWATCCWPRACSRSPLPGG